MLEKVGHYNDLSPKLRKKLDDKIASFGEGVRVRFDISHENPDPEKQSGMIIFPNLYTLQPATFNILDKDEDRPDAQRTKRIGMVESIDANGRPERFRRIRVKDSQQGEIYLDLNKIEDIESLGYLLLHPKLTKGWFSDERAKKVVSIVDEMQEAIEERKERSARKKAMDYAEKMSDKEVYDFADALGWNTSVNIGIIRNDIEDMAENEYDYFNTLTDSERLQYQSVIQKAIYAKVIYYNPSDVSFAWGGSNQKFAQLSPVGEKNEVEKLAEFFINGDTKIKGVYTKIKNILSNSKVAAE